MFCQDVPRPWELEGQQTPNSAKLGPTTGSSGRPESLAACPAAVLNPCRDAPTALQEQLGLHLALKLPSRALGSLSSCRFERSWVDFVPRGLRDEVHRENVRPQETLYFTSRNACQMIFFATLLA